MNAMGILLTGFLHHSEPANPDLINWLLDSFENLVDLSPNVLLAVIFVFIVLIPILILLFYKFFSSRP